MATLGGYAQRQSQTASAADTTLQALMMLMQYQQQAEDRRLSREQMMLQNEQLQGLLRAQQREEVAQTPGTTAIRNISDVENQSVYSRLDQTINSLNTFMDNPELASDPMLNADLGLSPAVRSMQSGSPEEYAKVIRVLNAQLEQVQSMIDNSEVPAKEAERFMESLRGRIKGFANNVSEGVKFQQAYLQVLSEDNARGERGADGELISASAENPELLIPDDPLIELDPAVVTSFGKQAVQAGIRKVSESVVDAAISNLPEEDARTLQQQIEEDPSLIDTIGLAGNATEAIEDIIGNIPPAQETLIDRGINYAKENPGTAAVGALGAGYGAFKLWPLLRQSPAVAAALTGAEALGRAGQEQGLLPGEGVFVGDDSMLQGSLSRISRAQELQERLPEGERVGPIQGVLQGAGEVTGEAIRDLIPESLLRPFLPGMLGGNAAATAPQTAAAPAEGVIEKEVVRRDFGAEIPEQVTLEDLVAPAPPAAQYDPLDIEMQPSEIPAQADPKYIDYLTNLQFQASMQKAEEANRELAALAGLARETNTDQSLTFQDNIYPLNPFDSKPIPEEESTVKGLENKTDEYVPFSEEEYQGRQLMAEMLNQSAIDNMIEATRREQQAQALLSQLVAEQPVYNTASQMDQMQIQHLLQSTPNTGANLSFNPSTQMTDQSLMSLYALMGQPF